MRGVSGLVFRDRDRMVGHGGRTAGWPSSDGPRAVGDRGVALRPVGDEAWSERVGDALVVGDLDVSTLDETLAHAG